MSLVTLSEVLSIAEAEKSAIPAFNIDNLEIPEVIAEVAENLQRPIIFSVGQGAIKMSGLHSLADIVKDIANSASIPIALHLDHGISYEQTISCLREGFTSVMIDGSSLPLQENIALTKRFPTPPTQWESPLKRSWAPSAEWRMARPVITPIWWTSKK